MSKIDLGRYSTTPLFNTKAVVQETGVSAATLRAWERRYGVPEPSRTDSNYRLYSERDIALVRWLRERIEDGLTISQAVELYRRVNQGEALPSIVPGEQPGRHKRVTRSQDFNSTQQQLIDALKSFDEPRADRLFQEMFALYPIETVLAMVIQPLMAEIGKQWSRGDLSVPVEHFTTAFIERKLMALMNAQPLHPGAPLVVTGCAPGEQHEIGIMLFSLLLRRNGLRVIYFGPDLPDVGLRGALEALEPAMLALSASTYERAIELKAIGALVRSLPAPQPHFAFGGHAFQEQPTLVQQIEGLYLGDDLLSATKETLRYVHTHARR